LFQRNNTLTSNDDRDHLAGVGVHLHFVLGAICGLHIHGPVRRIIVLLEHNEQHFATANGSLFRKPMVWAYFISVFAYVGSEQGTADWISKFLSQYHGFDPHTSGATAVSWFWGLLTSGFFIGMGLLKIFDSRWVLIRTCLGVLLCLSAALFGPANVSRLAFPGFGLFASVMWPILVSLAPNSVSEHHGSFAGILSTGIMGGAVVPVIIGRIGDHFGLRTGVAFLYVTFGCVLSVGFWAKPIISNATLSLKKAAVETTLSS